MNYNTFKSIILPFFLQRWADMSWWLQNINNYIHLWLQAAALHTDWSFFKRHNMVVSKLVWLVYQYRTTEVIGKINFVKTALWWDLYLDKDFTLKQDSKWTYLETKNDHWTIEIEYYVEYNWINIDVNWTTSLPFPNRFIPALTLLVYDSGSPLVEFEYSRTPKWQIADKYLAKLADRDWVQDSGQISYNYN